MVKQTYDEGDAVWIHGIGPANKLTQGRVVTSVDLSEKGFTELHYIIEIPTHIEPLLEIRTWHTMSQDEEGPVGSLRSNNNLNDSNNKKIKQIGYLYSQDSHYNQEEPSPEEIMAALEKSQLASTHGPLVIPKEKPQQKRKHFVRKKRREAST